MRIDIDQQDILTLACESCREVYGGSRLPNAALLVRDYDYHFV
jgi:hypothetical protein